MDSNLRKLWQSYKETALYANSFFLMVNSAAGSALGFVFWIVAARLYPAEAVGLGSAFLSAAGLLSFVATLGLGSGLIRYLPGNKSNASALVNSCLTLSSLAGLLAALIFIIGIPFWSPALSLIRDDLRFGVTFIALVVSGTLFSVLGDTYLALRRAEFSLVQGSLMGLLKLILVAVLSGLFGIFGVLASWTLAMTTIVVLGLFLFLARLQPGYRPVPSLRREVSNDMVHFSFANYVSLGLWSTPGWVLPLLVVKQLGSQVNAWFYMGWAMSGLLFAMSGAISTSLFAEGSRQDTNLARDIKKSLKLMVVLVLPAAALLMAAGSKLLLAFGQQYSREGAILIRVLAPSVVPLSLNLLYLAIARVRKRLGEVILITGALTVGILGLSYVLLPRLGIKGVGVACLVSHSAVALAGLPRFIRVWRTSV